MDHRFSAGEGEEERSFLFEFVKEPRPIFESQFTVGSRQGLVAIEVIAMNTADVAFERQFHAGRDWDTFPIGLLKKILKRPIDIHWATMFHPITTLLGPCAGRTQKKDLREEP
jgi:hypothetical protein